MSYGEKGQRIKGAKAQSDKNEEKRIQGSGVQGVKLHKAKQQRLMLKNYKIFTPFFISTAKGFPLLKSSSVIG